jgi:hypothetical protein
LFNEIMLRKALKIQQHELSQVVSKLFKSEPSADQSFRFIEKRLFKTKNLNRVAIK